MTPLSSATASAGRRCRSPKLDQLRGDRARVQLIAPPEYPAIAAALDVPDWVEVIDDPARLEQALAECTVCVTDYSRFAFDAARCGAPTSYYQFDRSEADVEAVLSLPSTFRYENAGFGPVTETVDDALDALLDLLDDPGGQGHRERADFVLRPQPGQHRRRSSSRDRERGAAAPRCRGCTSAASDRRCALRLQGRPAVGDTDLARSSGRAPRGAAPRHRRRQTRTRAEQFAADLADGVDIVDRPGTAATDLSEQLGQTDWVCVIQAGAVLEPDAVRRLHLLSDLRPDLAVGSPGTRGQPARRCSQRVSTLVTRV